MFKPLFSFRLLVLIVLAVVLGITTVNLVSAQDTSPLVTNTPAPALVSNPDVPIIMETALPPENPRGGISWEAIAPYIISMFIIAILGISAIAGTSLILLYRSIPPAAQSILTGGIDSLIAYLKTVAANTPQPWDDEIVKAGEERWAEVKKTAIDPSPSEVGQGLVEYALILVLVAVVVIVILALLGPTIGNIFSNLVVNLQCGGVPCPQ